jgi:hypothetical protein
MGEVSLRVSQEAEILNSTISKIESAQKSLAALDYNTTTTTFTKNIFKFQAIKKEVLNYTNIVSQFATEMYDSEAARHNFQIACIVFIPLLTIGFIVAYKMNKAKLVLLFSLILYVFIIPSWFIMGVNTSYFLLTIDFCKDVHKYVTAESKPYATQGLGVYLPCPSKPTQVDINTAMYELSLSFNGVINEVNSTMISLKNQNLGLYKRNNTHFKTLANEKFSNSTDMADTNIKKGLMTLYHTNDILQSLTALTKCQTALDSINYLDEKFCYGNISLMFKNLFFYFFGIIGLLMLSVGANKLVVLLNPHYKNMDKNLELLNEPSIN